MKHLASNTDPEIRPLTGRFQPGESGNPGGRPKVEGKIRELAQQHGASAIERLVELMKSDNERVAVSACQAILDRAYGKPAQALEHTGKNGAVLIPENYSELEAARRIAHLLDAGMRAAAAQALSAEGET